LIERTDLTRGVHLSGVDGSLFMVVVVKVKECEGLNMSNCHIVCFF